MSFLLFVVEPVEGGVAADGVQADHPTDEPAGHLGREVAAVELGQRPRTAVVVLEPEDDGVGAVRVRTGLDRAARRPGRRGGARPRSVERADPGPGDDPVAGDARPRSGPCRPCRRRGPASAVEPGSTSARARHVEVLLAPADEHRVVVVERGVGPVQREPARPRVERRPRRPAAADGDPRGRRRGSSKSSRPRTRRLRAVPAGAIDLQLERARPRASRRPTRPARGTSRGRARGSRAHTPRADAEQHHPPRAVGGLDEVGVPGVLDRLVGAAVAQDRIGRAALPRADRRRPRAIDTAWPRGSRPRR